MDVMSGIAIILLNSIIWGFVTGCMAEKRNQKFISGFWWGFFLGLVGVFIVWCSDEKHPKENNLDEAVEKLERYKKLLDDGIISSEEFEEVKKKYLIAMK